MGGNRLLSIADASGEVHAFVIGLVLGIAVVLCSIRVGYSGSS
jgi:hypothetical protein